MRMGAPTPLPTLDLTQHALLKYIRDIPGRVLGQGVSLLKPFSKHMGHAHVEKSFCGCIKHSEVIDSSSFPRVTLVTVA